MESTIRKRSLFISLLIAFAIMLSTSVAQALSMEIVSFTGTIKYSSFEQYSGSDFDIGIEVGDTFAGYLSLAYDPSLAPVGNAEDIYSMQYSYYFVFQNLSFSYGPTNFSLYVENTPGVDVLSFWSMPGIVCNDQYIEDLHILLKSSEGNALTGSSMPPSIDWTAMDYGRLDILFGFNGVESHGYPNMYPVWGDFDTITAYSQLVPVPEPGTFFLCALGIFGLIGGRAIGRGKL